MYTLCILSCAALRVLWTVGSYVIAISGPCSAKTEPGDRHLAHHTISFNTGYCYKLQARLPDTQSDTPNKSAHKSAHKIVSNGKQKFGKNNVHSHNAQSVGLGVIGLLCFASIPLK